MLSAVSLHGLRYLLPAVLLVEVRRKPPCTGVAAEMPPGIVVAGTVPVPVFVPAPVAYEYPVALGLFPFRQVPLLVPGYDRRYVDAVPILEELTLPVVHRDGSAEQRNGRLFERQGSFEPF